MSSIGDSAGDSATGVAGRTPSRAAICQAQRELLDRLGPRIQAGLEALTCWACGSVGEPFVPARAHVLAKSKGGSFDPSNFLLLCDVCHREQPDGATLDAQIAWLVAHERQGARVDRYLAPAFAEIDRIGFAAGDESAARRWAAERLPHAQELLRAGAGSAAGASVEQAMRNAAWALVDDFRGWLAKGPA